MKVPFRQQVSDYDCVPTSLINALCYLFDRRDIPPFIVHRVYKDCLDVESARGTTGHAIRELGLLLNQYKEKRFKNFHVASRFIAGDQVHFRQNSHLMRCINSNGVAVMRVHMNWNAWHSIVGFRSEGGWLHCYDPAPRTKRFINVDAVQFVAATDHQNPNLKIRLDWLEKDFNKTADSNGRKYILGRTPDRQCLLLNRIHV